MKHPKVIFHVDMNSFYASVEAAYDPRLKGKAIAIAGNPEERKGIIVTSSYEARAKGVKTTMPLWEAKSLCPELIVIRPNFNRYRETSAKIFKLLFDITPLVEPVSIDEGYLDVTNVMMHPLKLATHIQQTILKEVDIPCSIGIGPNKFLAKTASDMKKPLGITVLRKRELKTKLWPLAISDMYGVGKKTAEKLHHIQVVTIGDLAHKDSYILRQLLGINGERLKNRANGIDPRVVDPDSVHDFKSIGNSQTLPEDTTDDKEIRQILYGLANRVDDRLRRRALTGKTVQLMIRYYDRTTITRSKKLSDYVTGLDDIMLVIDELFHVHWNHDPIRLLGVTVTDLIETKEVLEQLSLFTYKERERKILMEQTVTKLKEKYGEPAFPALSVDANETDNEQELLRTSFQKDFLDDFKR
jgi:DNA polymerase-4